jgi:hypothetical protein
MPPADPEYVSKLFLRALDTNDGLRTRYLTNHLKEWNTLLVFRKEFGDTCSKVRGILSLMWLKELTRDKGGFFSALREASYGE